MRTFFLILFLSASALLAQLSPGDLHQVHADLEGIANCTQCHVEGQQLSPEKCFDCHSILKARIDAGKGLHINPDYKQCDHCHIEHQGRNFDLVYWKDGTDKFQHNLTGYILEGGHKDVDCRKCHNSKNIKNPQTYLEKKKDLERTYLGLSQECLSCHHDEHRGQLKTTCKNCHSFDKWKPALKFDHNKANYVLSGKHIEVECVKCHEKITDNKYPDDVDYLKFSALKYNTCRDCHKDVHENRFGPNCQKCHNTSGWANYAKNEFNHNQTRFPLEGKHNGLICSSCHTTGNKLKFKGFKICQDCHSDYHQGQFRLTKLKGQCEQCHNVNGFSPASFTIDQHNKGNYTLQGAHLAVPCFLCHKKMNAGTVHETMQFKFESTRCIVCHQSVHKETEKKYLSLISSITGQDGCEYCHQVNSWAEIDFDHTQTKFALEGKHVSTSCINCHKKEEGTQNILLDNAFVECQSCHQDKHAGQFISDKGTQKTNCQQCHTPNNWLAEKFNHDKDSNFKLTGAHQSVKCQNCHKMVSENGQEFVRYKPLSSECKSCHGSTIN